MVPDLWKVTCHFSFSPSKGEPDEYYNVIWKFALHLSYFLNSSLNFPDLELFVEVSYIRAKQGDYTTVHAATNHSDFFESNNHSKVNSTGVPERLSFSKFFQ
jgi:hypothetical protein